MSWGRLVRKLLIGLIVVLQPQLNQQLSSILENAYTVITTKALVVVVIVITVVVITLYKGLLLVLL